MKKGLVSVIIINWNGVGHLKKCLPSLIKQNYKNFELILVDNASKDDSVVFVKKIFPAAKIIINPKNLGFSEANNVGYRVAKGDYVLFLNNDTEVTTNFLTELITNIRDDKSIGGAQSKILFMEKRTTLDSVGAFLTYSGFLYHYGAIKKDSRKYGHKIFLYSAKGACMIFKRSVLKRIEVEGNIFDPKYFAYFEETDLCHRVWLAGYKIMYIPSSVIYHKVGGTSTKMVNSFIQFHSFKNRIRSHIKNLGTLNLLIILPVHLLVCEFNAFAFIIKRNFNVSFAIQKAIFWNILNISETLSMRRIVQRKIRKVNDKEINNIVFKKVDLAYYLSQINGTIKQYKDREIKY